MNSSAVNCPNTCDQHCLKTSCFTNVCKQQEKLDDDALFMKDNC